MTQTRPPQVSNAPVEGQILDSIFTSPVCLIHFGFGAAAYFAFIVYLAVVLLNVFGFFCILSLASLFSRRRKNSDHTNMVYFDKI